MTNENDNEWINERLIDWLKRLSGRKKDIVVIVIIVCVVVGVYEVFFSFSSSSSFFSIVNIVFNETLVDHFSVRCNGNDIHKIVWISHDCSTYLKKNLTNYMTWWRLCDEGGHFTTSLEEQECLNDWVFPMRYWSSVLLD